jgi:hypothetical protein
MGIELDISGDHVVEDPGYRSEKTKHAASTPSGPASPRPDSRGGCLHKSFDASARVSPKKRGHGCFSAPFLGDRRMFPENRLEKS